MKPITKAVFPVGGMGTRFLPATKSIPKEMLPIVDKPLIQHAVEEAIAAGIDTLIFITSASKHAISDHFDPRPMLRQKFVAEGKSALVEKLDTLPDRVTRIFIPQGEPLGLGHAVLQARPIIDNEHFAVILADDFIRSPLNPISALIETAHNTGCSAVSVEQVPRELLSRYGVVGVDCWQDGAGRVQQIVEKPEPENSPSRFGVIGRYVLDDAIFACLAETAPDSRGEIQLTDALRDLLTAKGLMARQLTGTRYDCGHKRGYVQATLATALADGTLSRENLLDLVQADRNRTDGKGEKRVD
jgi:UTP--glucose-1-phosphate uridylyltransferase